MDVHFLAGAVLEACDQICTLCAVEFKGADFFLTGKLSSLTTRSSKGVSDYILYTFQLIDARTSDIIWEGFEEIKKQGLEDAVYR